MAMNRILLTGTAVLVLVNAACLGVTPANAENMSDIPANRQLSETCGEVGFLGRIIRAVCFDRNNVPYRSKIDVRTCVGFVVVVNANARLVCKTRRR
jgi:hypothetical protein